MGCICIYLFVFVFYLVDAKKSTFKAAVYEHAVIIPTDKGPANRSTALKHMMKNIEIYKEQATKAGKQNVEIMVFPEYGIYGTMKISREGIASYLEYIPDPEENWNACQHPDKYEDTDIQRHISCLAKDTSMYLVVNFGDRQPCDIGEDPNCPKDGHYQFNTNVVYNPKGDLIAKYHKIQLYNEKHFDIPPVTKLVTFETPFGKFAVFTCFDILFKTPAIDVLKLDGVGNVVFPTAWMDALPLLAGIQFHSAFAAGAKVNLLAANINLPKYRFHGSGIYSPTGYKAFHYSESHGGKLLIDDLPVVKTNAFTTKFQRPDIKIERSSASPGQFKSEVRHDPFMFVPIQNNKGNVSVCDGKLCCFLSYERVGSDSEYFAFGAFDGLHKSRVQPYYLKVCTLLKCKTANRTSCGDQNVKESLTNFTSIKLKGTFETRYVFPEVLLADNGLLKLSSGDFWTYADGTLESKNGFEHPVLSVSLLSRDYERDNGDVIDERDQGNKTNDGNCIYSNLFLITVVAIATFCIE
ncbi:pantetheinase-like [Mytilus galloprovincialis]|uniref:pantetheinase-like n=1 Tax=Mytilus galloprovincialis TaxID=29158 RepID=UPI003F7BF7D6